MSSVQWLHQLRLPRSNIFEVGPRDGLQNESTILSVDARVELITRLIESGLRDIEVGSFVRADRIPALAGSGEVIKKVLAKNLPRAKDCRFWAFIPNQKGFDDALDAGVSGVALFVAASDTFCQKNVNRPLAQQKADVFALLEAAHRQQVPSRVYLSTLVYCPYEGVIAPEKVIDLASELIDHGATKVVLSDTTGHADPVNLARVLELCDAKRWSPDHFALHLHDTRGLALVNAEEGLRWGISEFDASVAGLGGCPYAPGASGNLATEDLANLLDKLGLLEGVSLKALARAGHFVEKSLGKRGPSKVLRTFAEES
ncbi:MAG TPA: hydroxymethylglutaryl-CoA lyase [Bdellovibrionota bacterium]|jgi:hydroxymethylglutaryl-CoA lyase|nr:hydroxymethylglutaryl-CoA lyase [Bdellovibrionota bacterium]